MIQQCRQSVDYFFVCRTDRCSEMSSFEARQRESPKELASMTHEAVGMSR